MITSGVEQALDVALRLLVRAGQPVLVETPTYPNALAAVVARRGRLLTHGLADSGWDADLLLATVRQNRPRLAYLVTEFQNPTGHLMDARLRERLPAGAPPPRPHPLLAQAFLGVWPGRAAEAPPPGPAAPPPP